MEAIKALRQWIVFFCPPVDEGRYRGTANLDLLYSPQQKKQAAPGEESQALRRQQRFIPLEVQTCLVIPTAGSFSLLYSPDAC